MRRDRLDNTSREWRIVDALLALGLGVMVCVVVFG